MCVFEPSLLPTANPSQLKPKPTQTQAKLKTTLVDLYQWIQNLRSRDPILRWIDSDNRNRLDTLTRE